MPKPPRSKPSPERMLEAAKLFARHEEYRTIAERLKMNRRDVPWLLEHSVSWLIGQQKRLETLQKVDTVQNRLEQRVITRFPHLRRVQVVPSGKIRTDAQYAALVHEWGRLGAEYLDRLAEDAASIEQDLKVGVSGGETILEVVSQLPERDRPTTVFHALELIGHGEQKRSSFFHVGAEANVTIAWSRSGRLVKGCQYATVPPYRLELRELTPEERRREIAFQLKSLWETDEIKNAIIQLNDVDVVFVGLGVVDTGSAFSHFNSFKIDRFTMTGLLKPFGIEARELASEGAVGDIGCCLFNAEGTGEPKEGSKERWRYFLTAGHDNPEYQGVEFYRNLVLAKRPVVVIAGVYKEPAIRAALKGELFNHWITDDETARRIIEE